MIEIGVITLLLILNGIFAMAEIAIVSSKKSRLQQWANEGNRNARTVLTLMENPERFLSTVQIGITLVGVFSGAFGGASLAKYLAPLLEPLPLFGLSPASVAFAIVVALITYFSLIIGELVPKGLALRNPEKIAMVMAQPMALLSRIASPLVWVLAASTKLLMKLFGTEDTRQDGPSREEVQVLVREGMVTGDVQPEENEMVSGVFDLQNIHAEEIMLPRPKVTFLPSDATHEQIWQRIQHSKQSVFPIYEGSRDQICGLVSIRALYASLSQQGTSTTVKSIMQAPSYVVENQPALKLMKTLSETSLGAALVTDEFGTIRGLITMDDIIEEVVGDYRKDHQETPQLRLLQDNQWIADGMIEIDDILDAFPELKEAVTSEEESFQTLAGFLFHMIDRMPQEGESFVINGLNLLIADMDQQRIDKMIISRINTPEETIDATVILS